MTIILTILKWIGILLLALLGLILFLVLLVLLVPILYRLEGRIRGKPEITGKVTWFFKLLSVDLSYQEEFSFSVKAAGIQLLPKKKEEGAARVQADKPSDQKSASVKAEPAGSNSTDSNSAGSNSADSKAEDSAPAECERTNTETANLEAANPETADTKNADAKSIDEKNAETAAGDEKDSGTAQKEPESLEEKLQRTADKAEAIRKKIAHYLSILGSDQAQVFLHNALVQVLKILKHILPRKMDVYLEIGTGDPASTGQILALQGILYPVLHDKVRIVPDFEEKRAEGEFYISGRITLGALLVCAVRIILKKEVLYLIKRLRKKEEA